MSENTGTPTPPEADEPKAGVAPAAGEGKAIVFPPLLSLWLFLAGCWETGEVAWTILRALARLIA